VHAKYVRQREGEMSAFAKGNPVATEPSGARFSGLDSASNCPLSARTFQALGDNLFASTFNRAAADQIILARNWS
jgi:hypothetical protein